MRSSPGRPRKSAPKPLKQQPTDAPVVEFTRKGEGPGGSHIFGYECYNCSAYEHSFGGRQQKDMIHNKALTHKCGVERDSWKDRDVYDRKSK